MSDINLDVSFDFVTRNACSDKTIYTCSPNGNDIKVSWTTDDGRTNKINYTKSQVEENIKNDRWLRIQSHETNNSDVLSKIKDIINVTDGGTTVTIAKNGFLVDSTLIKTTLYAATEDKLDEIFLTIATVYNNKNNQGCS